MKCIIISFIQLTRQILFGKRPDVIFYYPQLFNRSKKGTNPFFEQLIEICKKNNIRYLVLEEPAGGCGFPRDSRCVKADVIYWFVVLMHKIKTRWMHYSLHDNDKRLGGIIDILTFHRLRAKTYITISNSMIDLLGELNPYGNVYDFQHGIIYNGHEGYFSAKDILREPFLINNRRVLLWGNLYKKNLMNLPGGVNPDDKFIVVGYPMYRKIEICNAPKEKRILVSMQFTSDISPEVSEGILEMLDEFAEEAVNQGYELLLKHHPRFAGEVDINPLIEKYKGKVSLTEAPLPDLAGEVKLQITWGSTTTMEYAAYGVPTVFLRDERFDWATDMFYGQYGYPLYDGMTASEVLRSVDDEELYQQDCLTVKEWYEAAYSPLDEELLLKILKGKLNEKE